MPKVLFIFAGSRKRLEQGRPSIDYPDTQFYGYNHLLSYGQVEYKTPDDSLPIAWLRRWLSFPLKHLLLTRFFHSYDVIIGSSLLYNVALKKFLAPKSKLVLLNISLNNTLARNKNNSRRYRRLLSLASQLDAIICLSQAQLEDLHLIYGLDPTKLHFIPMGVDPVFWQPVDRLVDGPIIAVGTDNGRDFSTVFEAARLMPEERFVVVCGRRNVANLDIPDNVLIHYGLGYPELKRAYKSARLALIITHDDTHTDGADCSGQTSLLDALAQALPVIISKKRYLSDYVQDGREVIEVDCYQPAQIVEAIHLLSDFSLGESMRQAGRQAVEERFTSSQLAEHLQTLLTNLAK